VYYFLPVVPCLNHCKQHFLSTLRAKVSILVSTGPISAWPNLLIVMSLRILSGETPQCLPQITLKVTFIDSLLWLFTLSYQLQKGVEWWKGIQQCLPQLTLKVIHFCGCLHELPTIGRRGMVERDPTVLSSVNSEGNFY